MDLTHTRFPTMADDDWQRPVFTDEEWRRLALERHKHDVLQGFEGTADERQRELERHIFSDEDVAAFREREEAEYENAWQQEEVRREQRRREVSVGSFLSKFKERFEAIRLVKEEFVSAFDDEDDEASGAVESRRRDETGLLAELEAFCVTQLGGDASALERVLILPPGLSPYERIERMMTAVTDLLAERLARTPSSGDFTDEDKAKMPLGQLEANRLAYLSSRQLEEKDDCCICTDKKIALNAVTCISCQCCFHDHCIAKVLDYPRCPMCRKPLFDDDTLLGMAKKQVRTELEEAGLARLLDCLPDVIESFLVGRRYVFSAGLCRVFEPIYGGYGDCVVRLFFTRKAATIDGSDTDVGRVEVVAL